MRCACRVKKRKSKKLIVISVLLLLCLGIYLFFVNSIRPVIQTISQETIRALTVENVNLAVAEVMAENPTYVDLSTVERDNDGNISLITTNSAVVNSLARSVTVAAQKNLEKISDKGVGIPIGSLSGISFLSGRGPSVNIKTIPIGSVETSFSSKFEESGINQTLHKLYINVSSSVNIIIPGSSQKVNTVTEVLVSETIIIGKVPHVYLSSQSSSGGYNFVP